MKPRCKCGKDWIEWLDCQSKYCEQPDPKSVGKDGIKVFKAAERLQERGL